MSGQHGAVGLIVTRNAEKVLRTELEIVLFGASISRGVIVLATQRKDELVGDNIVQVSDH